jgi:hypothetical protein
MQRSAFIIALFALFALFSVALASPVPVRAVQEARELVVELNVRESPAERELLSREVDADSESGANLPILARERQSFDEYVEEMSGGNTVRDTSDIEPRICRYKLCA